MSRSMFWIAQSIIALDNHCKKQFNPRPPGSIVSGSVTDIVLSCLLASAPKRLTRAQIVGLTKAPPKSVDWALHVLRKANRVVASEALDKRNERYLKYKGVV